MPRSSLLGAVLLALAAGIPAVALDLRADRVPAERSREDPGDFLDPPARDLQPLALEPDADTLDLVQRLSGVQRDRLDRAELYAASSKDHESLRVATLPLAGALEGATLVLGIADDGRLLDGALFGRKDVEEDEHRTWRRLVEQFAWAEVELRDTAEIDPAFEAESYWARLAESAEESDRWSFLLYEIRRTMIGNSDFYQRIELAGKRGATPNSEWLASYVASFERLDELGGELAPFLGDTAGAAFSERARAAGELTLTLASAAKRDDREAVFEVFAGMQDACFQCHDIRGHELGWDGPLVFPGIEKRLGEYGVRNDLFRVGMDVWSPPGQEAAAQEVADAVQALLILVGAGN